MTRNVRLRLTSFSTKSACPTGKLPSLRQSLAVALLSALVASLPVAGKAGTLANRLKGTAAEGVVKAKTGSFTNARAVAGFTTTADGEPVVFSVIANNYGVPTAPIDRATDAIILALTTFRR